MWRGRESESAQPFDFKSDPAAFLCSLSCESTVGRYCLLENVGDLLTDLIHGLKE